jgi:hypothetical protein
MESREFYRELQPQWFNRRSPAQRLSAESSGDMEDIQLLRTFGEGQAPNSQPPRSFACGPRPALVLCSRPLNSHKNEAFGKLVWPMWTSSKLGLRSKAVVSTSKTRGARHQPT